LARIFGDSFDTVNTAYFPLGWDKTTGNVTPTIETGVVGATGNCLRLAAGLTNNDFVRKNLPDTYSRLCMGMRHQCYALPVSGYAPICSYWDGAAASDTTLYLDAAGQLSVWYSNRGTQSGSSSVPALIHPGTWSHIIFDLTWGTSGAGFNVYVNSQLVLTASSVQTSPNNSNMGMVGLWGGTPNNSGQAFQFFDDFYVNDFTGSYNNGSDGDIEALPFFPNAAGQFTQMTIGGTSPAATNFGSVNQTSPDDDVTYVLAATNGLLDTYKVGPLPANVSQIVCVDTIIDGKTDAAGLGAGATVAPVLGNGTTTVVGTAQTLNTNYQYRRQYWGFNPITTTAWSLPDWNSVETGIKRIS